MYTCTVGWVNFSEFKFTVCGSCKMSKRTYTDNFFIFFVLLLASLVSEGQVR